MTTSLKVFSKKSLSMTLLGFASGLPYMLIFSTLATWLAVVSVDIKTIGFFAWVTLTYSLKVFWAPLVDNFSIPLLNRFGKTDDISNAISFLLSEKSNWITAQTINIDGGLSKIR